MHSCVVFSSFCTPFFIFFLAFDEKQILKRKEIESRPLFERSNNKDNSSSLSKGQNTKLNLAKSIALNKGSPFDLKKSPFDSSKQMKDLGIRKRSAVGTGDQANEIPQKHAKSDLEVCNLSKESMTSMDCSSGNVQDTSQIDRDLSGNTGILIRDTSNCDNDPIYKGSESSLNNRTDQVKNGQINVINALSLVSEYADSDSNSSDG